MKIRRASVPLVLLDRTLSIAERLRAARLRVTTARVSVLKVLEAAGGPVPVEEVYRTLLERNVPVSVGTVYRIISALANLGMLGRNLVPGIGGIAKSTFFLMDRHSSGSAPSLQLSCQHCRATMVVDDSVLAGQLAQFVGSDQPGPGYWVLETDSCNYCQSSGTRSTVRNARRAGRGPTH